MVILSQVPSYRSTMHIDVSKVLALYYHELYPPLADRNGWEAFKICFEVL